MDKPYEDSQDVHAPACDNPLYVLAKSRMDAFRSAFSTTHRTPSSIQQLRDDLQTDLDAAELIRSQLAEALNECSPIALLPAEVLCAIFELVAQDYRPYAPVDSELQAAYVSEMKKKDSYLGTNEIREPSWLWDQGGRLGWVLLSHVCRSWRRVLLGFPAVWADNFGTLPKALDATLLRSGGLPLTLRTYNSRYRNSLDSWRILLRDDVRCRVQKIYCFETRKNVLFKNIYGVLTTCHFPILEVLHITGNEPAAKSGSTLRVISAPQLREIDYKNAFIPTSSEIVESVSLSLTLDEGYNPDDMMRTEDLVSILNQTQSSLMTLAIDHCITDYLQGWPPTTPICLSRLRSFTITEPSYSFDMAKLLGGLVLHDHTLLEIKASAHSRSTHDVAPAQNNIRAAVSSVNGIGFDALSCVATSEPYTRSYDTFSDLSLQLYASSSLEAHSSTIAGANPVVLPLPTSRHIQRLDIRKPIGARMPFSQFMLPISQTISLSDISVLICGGPLLSEHANDLLRRFPGCHTLQIVNAHESAAVVLDVLADSKPADVLPRLEHLWLTQTSSAEYPSYETPPTLSFARLTRRLSSRQQQVELTGSGGMPTTLTIDASVRFTQDRSTLKAILPKLVALIPNIDWRRA